MSGIKSLIVFVAVIAAALIFQSSATALAGGATVNDTTGSVDRCTVDGIIEKCVKWERNRHEVRTPSGNQTLTIDLWSSEIWTDITTGETIKDISRQTRQHRLVNSKKNVRRAHVNMHTAVTTDNLTGCVTTNSFKLVNDKPNEYSSVTVCP